MPQHSQPPHVATLKVHDHPCSVYATPEELKGQFVPFFQSGLLLGEQCIYFVDENSPDFVVAAMQENGFALKHYIETGAFKVISTADAHLSHGHFAEDKMMTYWKSALVQAQQQGYPAVRACVEMTWALSGKPGCYMLAPYEARLNKFTEANNISVICAYHRGKFSPEKIKAIIHAHPQVITEQKVLNNPSVVPPERFIEGDPNLDVQTMLDNLELIARLDKAQDKLREQEHRTQQLYEELQHLARAISHELQEPISVVISYLRLLSVRYTGRLGEDADEFIARSVGGARAISRMIDDLWAFARADAKESAIGELDTMQVLGDVLTDLKERLEERRAYVSHDNLPKVNMTREHLKFIFRELIDNATKYDGLTPKVHISAQRVEDGWQFAVKDNGRGISRVFSRDIFKVFNRLGKHPDENGSGMGLPIAKKMVEHHRGQIWVESEEGHGSTFYFTVPDPQPHTAPLSKPVADMQAFAAQKHALGEELREA